MLCAFSLSHFSTLLQQEENVAAHIKLLSHDENAIVKQMVNQSADGSAVRCKAIHDTVPSTTLVALQILAALLNVVYQR